MNWKRIKKEESKQPRAGNYSDWKEQIARECYFQCVYCAIHDSDFGGQRNFHVEHYRPKSRFPRLVNDIKNLFYACAICNTFKREDWPNEPCKKFSLPSYADPSRVDYKQIFDVIQDGKIAGRFVCSRYMVERLFLNRPQLIIWRRKLFLRLKLRQLYKFNTMVQKKFRKANGKVSGLFTKMASLLLDAYADFEKLTAMRPYEEGDVKKTNR